MLGWIDLKLEIASCWKVSWNVDPAALSVPPNAADDEPLFDEEPPNKELLLDEEHAPRVSASATTATPAIMACCLHRSRILCTPQICILLRNKSAAFGRPVSL
jgi:hypothetical protein